MSKMKISKAKGRPMLSWVGKKTIDYTKSFPAQIMETFNPLSKIAKAIEQPTFDSLQNNWQNLLFHGDNLEVMGYLLENGFRGKIDLVYIDPPFDSGANYVRKVKLRGFSGRLEGEEYAPNELIQYSDIWANDNYLQFMFERLLLIKELMSEESSIFMHTDWHRGHQLRCLMDEVFGEGNFRNEIIVPRGRKKSLLLQFEKISTLGVESDTILLYSKSDKPKYKIITCQEKASEEQWQSFWRGNFERPTMLYPILGFNPTHGQNLWEKGRGLRAAEN
jgi:adenine specific DNA methylase Mod